MTKYATVLHILTGEGLCRSGSRTLNIMKRHFSTGVVSATVGESVLRTAASILAFCVKWVSFLSLMAYYNRLFESPVLRDSIPVALLFLFLFASFFPVLTAFVLFMLFAYAGGSTDDFQVDGSILLLSIVLGVFANLVLRYIGDIINDALSAVFVCYAIAKDNDLEETQVIELERLIDVVLTDSLLPKDQHQNPA